MSQKTLLLVDDSKSARFMIKKLVEKLDIKVDTAESGEEALEYLKTNKPYVVFMDHLMPGLDGLQTTQAIKSDPNTNEIPVVLCTSNDGPEHKKNAIEHGAIDLLAKPPSISRIKEILDSISTSGDAPVTTEAASASISPEEINKLVNEGVTKWLETNLSGLINQSVSKVMEAKEMATVESVKVEISTLKAQMEKVLELKAEQAEKNAENLAKQLSANSQPSNESIEAIVKPLIEPQITGLKGEVQNTQKQILAASENTAKKAAQALVAQAVQLEQQNMNKKLEHFATQISGSDFINKTTQQVLKAGQEQINQLSSNTATSVATDVATNVATNTAQNILQEANEKMSGASSKALIYSLISMVVAIGVSVGAIFALG